MQICDDTFELRNCANNVDLQNPLATTTRYAWVTLQALGTMDSYLCKKFWRHQAINSTFIHFLTQHMADQTSVGLKTTVDNLKASVAELKKRVKAQESGGSKKIMQDSIDSRVN